MGVCKGCGSVVTSLYCYAHRVNACESCIVEQHPRCIVHSYKAWLKDVDTDPNCSLCHSNLEQGDVVRLVCLDLFHLDCLCKHTREQPIGSVPKCPLCSTPILPPISNASPIAESLRTYLPILGAGTDRLSDTPSEGSSEGTRSRAEVSHQTQGPLFSPTRHSIIQIESNVSRNETFEESVGECNKYKYDKQVRKKLSTFRAPWKRTYTSSSVCSPKVLKLIGLLILFILFVFAFSHFHTSVRKKASNTEFVQGDIFFKVGRDT